MQITNVHARDIAAAPAEVGALLDCLGTKDDRLWPTDRWPNLPFKLDGPVTAGAPARHGPIRYLVDAYEPGRRLTFRFAPGLGLVGTHGFEIEPLDEHRTRLTHMLQARVELKMLPVWPFVRGYHDALLEDVLAQADRAATGRAVPHNRWPLWLRLANGAQARLANRRSRRSARTGGHDRYGALMDRLGAVGGVAVPPTLAVLAALHAAWALGWHWPGGSERELAERVLSGGTEMPPDWATWIVAMALAGAATVVRVAASHQPPPTVRRMTWGVASVFLIRGAAFVPFDLIRGLNRPYERLDLAIYSPLCLLLGVGAGAVARRASPVSAISQGARA